MTRQILSSSLALAAALIVVPVLVSAQPVSLRIGKRGEIQLTQPTRFGTTLLKPGHYEVQHAMADGQHSVVIREQMQMNKRHTALLTGSEVARIPCRVLTLNKPARFSFAYWIKGTDGNATVTEIRIAEEPAGHIIAVEPKEK
jgi:hypothetical protein